MTLKWKDAQRIAEELYDNEPDLDPVTLRLSELRERVLALPDFDDDPEKSNEPILEAILQAWLDERRDQWRAAEMPLVSFRGDSLGERRRPQWLAAKWRRAFPAGFRPALSNARRRNSERPCP